MQTIVKKKIFVYCIKMINLSLYKLGLKIFSRGIKGYKTNLKMN